jgi:mono/diheme cytochrome c family protein
MRVWHILMMIGVTLLIAGCSSAGSTETTTTNSATATSPVKQIPTFSFSQPTAPPQVATAAVSGSTAVSVSTAEVSALNPEAVERGKARYEALDCASCHGTNGEGTDKGISLLEYKASEADFVTFMRSGGSLRAAHQYAANRLSESGAANLYQYLLSFQGQ